MLALQKMFQYIILLCMKLRQLLKFFCSILSHRKIQLFEHNLFMLSSDMGRSRLRLRLRLWLRLPGLPKSAGFPKSVRLVRHVRRVLASASKLIRVKASASALASNFVKASASWLAGFGPCLELIIWIALHLYQGWDYSGIFNSGFTDCSPIPFLTQIFVDSNSISTVQETNRFQL